LVYGRGGKGKSEIEGVKIIIPSTPKRAKAAEVPGTRGHRVHHWSPKDGLSYGTKLSEWQKGIQINALMATTAWNLKKR
jgi:IS5 family transposase